MRKPVAVGDLRDLIHFQRRKKSDDGFGNQIAGDWITQFTLRANLKPLKGSETVIASRLAGIQPYVLTVRASPMSMEVSTDWRLVDARNADRVFNITAVIDPDGRRRWVEITATEGVPGGE